MNIDLPHEFSIGSSSEKNKAYIEDGILKMEMKASFRYVMYELTFMLRGGKHQCCYCGKSSKKIKMTIDHMYPQDLGGPTITNNLLPACQKCNSEKSNMNAKQYKRFLQLKEIGRSNEFWKDLRHHQEYIKKWYGFDLPKGWISNKEISQVLLYMKFDEEFRGKTYKNIMMHYDKYGYLPKPIIIDKNGFLLDGFRILMFAKNKQIKKIPIIQLDNVEIVF